MAYLKRMSVSPRAGALRPSLPRLCILSAGMLFAGGANLEAAPVTFQFAATISQVQGDAASLNLPFALNVGQQINGKYSFASEQDLLDIFNHQPGSLGQLSLTIGGSSFDAWTNFGSLNSGGPVDINGPPPSPSSSLFLGYLSPTDVYPGTGPSLWLVGAEGTISAPQNVLDVNVWNQLNTLRRLDLQFGYPNTVAVQATVGNFFAVPEPRSDQLVFVLILLSLVFFLLGNFRSQASCDITPVEIS